MIEKPSIRWTEKGLPFSELFEDVYFSNDDPLAEIVHVFIQPNGLETRFKSLLSGQTFTIYETGFGSGLNFFSTLALWLKSAPENAHLHFNSFEKFPLTSEQIQQVLSSFEPFRKLVKPFISQYPLLINGWHDIELFDGRVQLTLWLGDVSQGIQEFSTKADVWFLDGFAPAKNPEMWQPELFSQMARLSHVESTFSTFTAASMVRKGLENVGFEVIKQEGFGNKREMLVGKLAHQRTFSDKTPWFSPPEKFPKVNKTACVIGAGLAGATVAVELAEAGWQVQVVEEADHPATKASGNLAGAIHPLITADWNIRSQFYLRGLAATLKRIKPLIETGEVVGELNGLFQLATQTPIYKRLQQSLDRVGLPADFVEWLSCAEISEKLGIFTDQDGVFFAHGGWVYPGSVVDYCLSQPNVSLTTGSQVLNVIASEKIWQVVTDDKVLEAEIVVVATGALDGNLNRQFHLPIRPVKGQVTHLKSEQVTQSVDYVVTHDGYSSKCVDPNDGFTAVTGATFEAPDLSETLSFEAQNKNLQMVEQALPNWVEEKPDQLQGKIGFRPTTPDHLPIIGALSDFDWAQQRYYSQSHTHAVFRYPRQQYQSGLYVSNGHGARGLMSTFLAAEMLVAMIEGKAPIMPRKLYDACHPERFRVRQWRNAKNPSV